MTAGEAFLLACLDASTIPVRMFVSLSTSCRSLKPGVFGLDTFRELSNRPLLPRNKEKRKQPTVHNDNIGVSS